MKKLILCHPLITKIYISIVAIICGVFICATPALACTGIYVGCDASADGTTMIAKSNDTSPLDKPLIAKVYGGHDGEQIHYLKALNGFEWNFPENINRTVCFPTVLSADGSNYCAVGMNNFGVCVNATVTGQCNKTALNYNPFVEDGFLEDVFPLVICAQATTAREGIELTAKIIDERGSSEDNIIMIADQNEVWYMEIYGGHQYCAIKAPSDCVTATGNDFLIETIDETSSDVICSENLFKLPAEKGFAVYDNNGKMNIWKTYAGPETDKDTCRLRTWRVHSLLSPSTSTSYNVHTKIPLFYKPDKKITLNEIMDIYRDRFEGTEFSIDANGKGSYRPINTETSQSIHLTQIYKDLPANMCLLNWMTWSNSEFTTWVPFSNLESSFADAYTYQNPNYYNVDDANAFSAFKKLNAIASQNRPKVKSGISEYWHLYEKYIASIVNDTLQEIASSSNPQDAINEFCKTWQAQNYFDALRLTNEISWYYMNSENVYSVKTVDGVKKIKEPAEFSPYVDIVLAAKILGWNIDEDKYQQHGEAEYDQASWGNKDQADNGGMEGYVKLSNGVNEAEIHTGNGHQLSPSKIQVNGQDIDARSKVYDGKTYVDIKAVNELIKLSDTNSLSKISSSDISPSRSYENIGPFNMPVWMQVLAITGVAIIVVALVYMFIWIKKKDKK